MDIAKDVDKELQDVLNMITSFPADWGEITISITAKSFAGDVTVTRRLELFLDEEEGTWVQF